MMDIDVQSANQQDHGALPVIGYNASRINAVRHGILSRFTVLPWEDETEYEALLHALTEEHGPAGPTETHLVVELASVLWRKRRLRLAVFRALDKEIPQRIEHAFLVRLERDHSSS